MPEKSGLKIWFRATVLVLLIAAGYVLVNYTPVGEWTSEERIRASLTEIRGTWWTPIETRFTPAAAKPANLPASELVGLASSVTSASAAIVQ